METRAGHWWVAVGFLNHQKYKELYPEKQEEYKKFRRAKGFFYNIVMFFVDAFLDTQQFSHCELCLPLKSTREQVLAFGVTQKDGCFAQKRSFANNDSYEWIGLRLDSEQQYLDLVQFCDAQEGKTWSIAAAQRSMCFPVNNPQMNGDWWCGSFVIASLKKVGFFKGYHAYNWTIDEIYEFLSKHQKRTWELLPSSMRAMKKLEIEGSKLGTE